MQAAKFSSHLLGPKHSSPDWESAEKAQDMLHAFPTGGLARHREFSQELTLTLLSVFDGCVFQLTNWNLNRKAMVLGDGASGEDESS